MLSLKGPSPQPTASTSLVQYPCFIPPNLFMATCETRTLWWTHQVGCVLSTLTGTARWNGTLPAFDEPHANPMACRSGTACVDRKENKTGNGIAEGMLYWSRIRDRKKKRRNGLPINVEIEIFYSKKQGGGRGLPLF